MAERIPDARFVELGDEDHLLRLGDVEELCRLIEEFVLRIGAATRTCT